MLPDLNILIAVLVIFLIIYLVNRAITKYINDDMDRKKEKALRNFSNSLNAKNDEMPTDENTPIVSVVNETDELVMAPAKKTKRKSNLNRNNHNHRPNNLRHPQLVNVCKLN